VDVLEMENALSQVWKRRHIVVSKLPTSFHGHMTRK